MAGSARCTIVTTAKPPSHVRHPRFPSRPSPLSHTQDEFAFSTERIYKNFSNYSAFHHRSAYARGYLREAGVDARDFVRAELEMVQQAVFTEPDDQTAWWCVALRCIRVGV